MKTTEWTPQTLAAELLTIVEATVAADENYGEGLARWRQDKFFAGRLFRDWRNRPTVGEVRALLTVRECGAYACVAGWAAILACAEDAVVDISGGIVYPDGRLVEAFDAGAQALGLYREQANWLFAANRSEEEVRHALEAIRDDNQNWWTTVNLLG